jgi:5-methylcytosine-specific restriction endonuclease McrA
VSPVRATATRPIHDDPYAAEPPAEPAPNRKRGGRRASGVGNSRLTTLPTGRAAYADTRAWLLKEHGPVCAYCGRSFPVGTMTLDHVAPRRGQTAYDRRDNLVLACRECNAAKRDLPPLAFLLQRRSRAVHLLRYGTHLSDGLVELARSLVPEGTSIRMTAAELGFHADEEEDDSPYA